MTNFFKLISIFILCSCIYSCQKMVTGNGISATESRNLNGSFNSIEVSTGIDLYLTQSQTTSISVKADKNIMEFINTEIEGETLKIFMKGNIKHKNAIKVMVHFKTIEQITASSGSDVFSTNSIKVSKLGLTTSSGSDMKLSVETDHLESNCSSGSNLTLEGVTRSFIEKSSSGSDLNASKLIAETCEANASSGANLSVNCLESFNANASSGGYIKNYGSSIKTVKNSSSGGKISTKN